MHILIEIGHNCSIYYIRNLLANLFKNNKYCFVLNQGMSMQNLDIQCII